MNLKTYLIAWLFVLISCLPTFTYAVNGDFKNYYLSLSSSSDLSGANGHMLSEAAGGGNLLSLGIEMGAQSLGVQAGTYFAEQYIKKVLDKTSSSLDELTDIGPYISHYKSYLIMPAIVIEINGQKKYLNEEKTAFQYADKSYIVQQHPYFIDSIPTWRDYVILNARLPKIASTKLLPTTKEEKRLWKLGFERGWKMGINTALETVTFQLTRAVYDMQGIQLYSMLRDANAISEPIIKHTEMNVTGDRNRLDLNSGVVQIKVEPTMNHDPKSWRQIPSLPPLDSLLPQEIYSLLNRVRP